MQGLGDGYFVLPNTICDYLADGPFPKIDKFQPAVVSIDAVRFTDRQAAVGER